MARERKFSTEELYRLIKELLIEHGYDGFTISLLADRLEVSRGALYKYFENKDDLITEFMIYEMQVFIRELSAIEEQIGFEAKFDFLMKIIFKQSEVHQLIEVAKHIQNNPADHPNKEKLNKLPLEMYTYLQDFITLGKREGRLKAHIPDSLMIGFILQSIAIPNHFGIPKEKWVESIKEIMSQGMFESS